MNITQYLLFKLVEELSEFLSEYHLVFTREETGLAKISSLEQLQDFFTEYNDIIAICQLYNRNVGNAFIVYAAVQSEVRKNPLVIDPGQVPTVLSKRITALIKQCSKAAVFGVKDKDPNNPNAQINEVALTKMMWDFQILCESYFPKRITYELTRANPTDATEHLVQLYHPELAEAHRLKVVHWAGRSVKNKQLELALPLVA